MAKPLAPAIIDGKINNNKINDKKKLRLDAVDSGDTAGWKKVDGVTQLETFGRELAELTNLLSYAAEHSLLIVFQGRDASGKDGAIRKVLSFANVLAAQVQSFKVPNEEERAHDFLWRIHKVVPARGKTALFNRSHYEDVIAVRVHKLLAEPVWQARFDAINQFESLLVAEKTIVVKFFLDVGQEEQLKRLLEREKDPRTAWKLNVNDWREIAHWKATTTAYEDVLRRCSPASAPWYLVPADHKWFRNLAVFERLVLTLRPYREEWLDKLKKVRRDALGEIEELRAKLGVKTS